MARTGHPDFHPDWASPPGETVAQILEERSITPGEFSRMLSEPLEVVDELLAGRLEICNDLAHQLSSIVGASSEFWRSRELHFRESLQEMERQVGGEESQAWLKSIPFRDMVRAGWVRATRKRHEQLSECLRFFGVPDVASWEQRYEPVVQNVAMRTSASFDSTPCAVAAWLRQGECEAAKQPTREWNASSFEQSLFDVRPLTREADPQNFIPRLTAICAESGVSVVVLKAPGGCRASGATRFVSHKHPLILLSARHLSDDHFWFTFFHEAGHLLLHGDRELFLEFDSSPSSPDEAEANAFAHKLLIPPEYRREFLQLRGNLRQIARFARQVGISPGVVVGQLQFLDVLKPNRLNGAKRRYQWVDSQLVTND